MKKALSLLTIPWNSAFSCLYLSLGSCFSCFLSYMWSLLRQPFCLSVFLFLWYGFDHWLLYSVLNLHSYFFRHFVYQIQPFESIYHFHSIITRELIKPYVNVLVVFPTFFNLSLNFTIRRWWYEPQSTPGLVLLTATILNYKEYNQSDFSIGIWWCPCVELSLVLMEKDVCYDQCVLLMKLS